MKTTVDLPESLVRQVKMRAAREGQKLQDVIADLLRRGLSAVKDTRAPAARPMITRDSETGLPVIQCPHPAAEGEELTPERVAEILLAQEVAFHVAR